jgi:hypothetical protein
LPTLPNEHNLAAIDIFQQEIFVRTGLTIPMERNRSTSTMSSSATNELLFLTQQQPSLHDGTNVLFVGVVPNVSQQCPSEVKCACEQIQQMNYEKRTEAFAICMQAISNVIRISVIGVDNRGLLFGE